MQPTLNFAFPWDISAHDAVTAVAQHFGVTVSVNGAAPNVPDHIKAAVERMGGVHCTAHVDYDPSSGTEHNPAIAFGHLQNGAAPGSGVSPQYAPSSAGADQSQTARAEQPVTSQTSAPVSSNHAHTGAPATVASSVAPDHASAVEFDSTGLPWDERIHSSKKTKTDSGAWRAMKGADKSRIKLIEAELRAKHANAPTTAAVASVSSAQFADEQARKRAALEYAHNNAISVVGPQQVSDDQLRKIIGGGGGVVELTISQNEWVNAYLARRNAAYEEFKSRNPIAPPQVAHEPIAPPQVAQVAYDPTALDSTGLPFDPRINISPVAKDDLGIFMQRMDVSPQVKLQVRAELRAAMASTAPSGDAQSQHAAPTPPAAPTIPQVTPEQAGSEFPKLMQWVVQNQMAGNITPADVSNVAKMFGFAAPDGNGQIALMHTRPEMFPAFVATLQSMHGAK